MGLHLYPWLVFPSQKVFKEKVLPNLVEKTKFLYVLFALSDCLFATTTFDLWMLMGAHDIFALIVNFNNENWQPKQVTIGFFEATKIIGRAMAMKLQALLDKYNLWKKILVHVKHKGSNLRTVTIALESMVSCENLRLEEPFEGN
jgi:hypothetical protein